MGFLSWIIKQNRSTGAIYYQIRPSSGPPESLVCLQPTFKSPAEGLNGYEDYVGFYLDEFENDYLYERVEDVLPPLRQYLEAMLEIEKPEARTFYDLDVGTRTMFNFTIRLVPVEVMYGKMAEIRDLLRYAKKNKLLNGLSKRANERTPLDTWYYRAGWKVLEELPYEEARMLIPSETFWRRAPREGAAPIDRLTYYHQAGTEMDGLRRYSLNLLREGYRALDPEEFIDYLHRLVSEKKSTLVGTRRVMEDASMAGKASGYCYFATVVERELNRL